MEEHKIEMVEDNIPGDEDMCANYYTHIRRWECRNVQEDKIPGHENMCTYFCKNCVVWYWNHSNIPLKLYVIM
jgi:hypothetical protein